MLEWLFQKKESIRDVDINKNDTALRLMFEIAISDGDIDSAELNLIKKRASKGTVDDEKASKIIQKVINESENSASLYPTIQKINNTYTKNKKIELLKNLWELVAINGVVDINEESLYFKIAELIKIKRSIANKIKHQAN